MTINIPAAIRVTAAIRVIESDASWTPAQRTALTRILNELVKPTVDDEEPKNDDNPGSDFFFPPKLPPHAEPEVISATDDDKHLDHFLKKAKLQLAAAHIVNDHNLDRLESRGWAQLYFNDVTDLREKIANYEKHLVLVAKEALGELNNSPSPTPGHCPKCGLPGSHVSRINGNIGYLCAERDGGCGHIWDEPPKGTT